MITAEIISSRDLIPVALTTGRSMTFMSTKKTEMYYATRRVANEILNAQYSGTHIDVWVQKPKVNINEDRKPWQKMNWLATPSRF